MSEELLVRLTEQLKRNVLTLHIYPSSDTRSPYTSIPLLTPDKDQRSKAFVFFIFFMCKVSILLCKLMYGKRSEGINYKIELKEGGGGSNNYVFLLYILYCQIIKHSYIYVGYRSVKVNKKINKQQQKTGLGQALQEESLCNNIYILIKFNYEE